MLNKLRRKMILINMTFVSVILLLTICVMVYSSYSSTWNGVYDEMELQATQAIAALSNPVTNTVTGYAPNLFHTPYATILIQDDNTWQIISEEGTFLSSVDLSSAITQALTQREERGSLEMQNLAYLLVPCPWGRLLVLRDVNIARHSMHITILASMALYIFSTGLCFLISMFLSSMAVRPISLAWQQQKQFIADASHELKTPLTVILANNHIMSSHQNETVAQQEKWLNATAEEGTHMRLLIDEMLTLAKIESNERPVELTPLNGSDLIEEELLYLEPMAYEKAVTLDIQIPRNLVWNSNALLLKKLVVLLVDNAIKYADPDSTVTISLIGGRTVDFAVRNFGATIPEEDIPHLFDRFYRSDRSRSSGGYGLGLSIALATSQKLRGEITVTSSKEQGTVFTVHFKP